MIKVSGLTKTFGNIKAVDDISFDVLEGENLVLLGTSGCGKTTTLKMINRLIDPDAGTISINEVDTSREKPELLRRKIGYVMQNIGLFPHYTVAENIAVVPRLLQWDKKHTINRTLELLKKLHLPENYLQLFPRELSGGQQQRVGLARALISDPDILLMDEPFGALDNVTRSSIQAEFKALEEFTKKTILMVTHDVQEAFELADRICLMDQGKIIQIGTPKELLFTPKNDFVIRFLDGQRLALQFKLVTIEDLWEFLPEDPRHTNKTISADKASMWSVMEAFSADRSIEHQFFVNTRTKTIKGLNFTQLTNAFNSYQNKEIHD
ncbi:MAG: ABC transporter ATP-binding protein [Pedobacter sp.]|nr:ABC transporter ATP-binding protein [Pedobacter sp.]